MAQFPNSGRACPEGTPACLPSSSLQRVRRAPRLGRAQLYRPVVPCLAEEAIQSSELGLARVIPVAVATASADD
eukprot:CAMPEP_0179074926 /NCGR_PEP_ID=MMETSP0796-20121207/33333_1 /TAXON_ID=73915 /ORGANISM="Pyrodinium bahamense, Strain pbaha01" /LENGTH=73 /DNA_ID=CAMNT_0020772155 /DNA_START=32 /DNA_END=251 /DNA_ORIENTATION=+